MTRPPRDARSPLEIDLHGLGTEAALRRLSQGIHTARMGGFGKLLVITGRGWGNPDGQPVLRPRVEAWLRGPEGQRSGVRSFERRNRGGALEVVLEQPQERPQ